MKLFPVGHRKLNYGILVFLSTFAGLLVGVLTEGTYQAIAIACLTFVGAANVAEWHVRKGEKTDETK